MKKQFYLYPFVVMILSFLLMFLPLIWLRIFTIITFFIGGLFPILISAIWDIDTMKHIKEQAVILILSIIACIISWYLMFFLITTEWIVVIIPVVILLLFTCFLTVKIKDAKEFFYLFISNPILYYIVFLILFISHI